jgi:preprotein translocase subunit SecG
MLIGILTVVEVLVCLFLILIVLMQRPRQEGLGASFGDSMTSQVWGAQTTNVLQKLTVWLAVILFVLTLTLAVLTARAQSTGKAKLFGEKAPEPAPAAVVTPTPAAPAPAAVTPATPKADAKSNAAPKADDAKKSDAPKATINIPSPVVAPAPAKSTDAPKAAAPAPEKPAEAPKPAPAPNLTIPVPAPTPAPAAGAPTPEPTPAPAAPSTPK